MTRFQEYKRELLVFLVFSILFFIFIWPALLEGGWASYENRGDTHFYADTARNFSESGHMRWRELYPVLLLPGAGTDMVWSAFGHPLAIAATHWLSGLGEAESAFVVSSLSYYFVLLGLYAIGLRVGLWGGLLLAGAGLVLPNCREYAQSGGTEALSQAVLVWTFFLLLRYLKKPRPGSLTALLSIALLGSFIRPHNSFLLISLIVVAFMLPRGGRRLFILSWLTANGVGFLLNMVLLWGEPLRFSYLFSFWVSTGLYPGHELFRCYMEGPGLPDLWEHRELLLEKMFAGWRLLKLNWPGWLWQAFATFLLFLRREFRPLAGSLSLVFAAGTFFACMGHLVPRYWLILEPLSLIACFLSLYPLGERLPQWSRAIMVAAVLFAALFVTPGQWGFSGRRLHEVVLPEKLVSLVPDSGLLASDRPAQLIDRFRRPILWCPRDSEVLGRISEEVEQISAILLSPNIREDELGQWKGAEVRKELERMGYGYAREAGWQLFFME
ncbi:MAG: hypothetical protein HQL31_08965 [Planctomycetes bacterium]|nr:hypothetical protein [Planctomycetota bacterium]